MAKRAGTGKIVIWGVGRRVGQGFTLIELTVVLAILVGMTMLFPFARDRLMPERQIRMYAERVTTDLRHLRVDAIERAQVTRLVSSGSASEYSLEPANERRSLPGTLTITVQPAEGSTLSEQAEIRFYADGSSSGGRVRVGRGDRELTIDVGALTGAVHIE